MATKLAVPVLSFCLEEAVAAGATSTVWRARASSGETLAIKVAQPQYASRLAQEALRLLFVESPSLARLRAVGRLEPCQIPEGRAAIKGSAYLAFDWVAGEPASTAARGWEDRAKLALQVAYDVGLALDGLHALGVAHGDVKPGNIVVGSDGQSGTHATLIDLGLAADAQTLEPQGGSPRYLAPELRVHGAESDARCRDLWALGLTLAELGSSRVAEAKEPLKALQVASLTPPLSEIVLALLSPAPGARPSASWVAWRASQALDHHEPASLAVARRQGAVRHAYLAARRGEILGAARRAEASVTGPGKPGEWLRLAVDSARQALSLMLAEFEPGEATLTPLDAFGRQRWLTLLVGASAASWPVGGIDEHELAQRLLALTHELEPKALSFAAVENGGVVDAMGSAGLVEVALALAGAVSVPVLERGEQLLRAEPSPPECFVLALGEALRLRGELGRAIGVLGGLHTMLGRAQLAEARRRAGHSERALAEVEALVSEGVEGQARSRAVATWARILLDRGEPAEALVVLNHCPEAAAVLESRALVELALGNSVAARSSIERGRAHANTPENLARIEGALGTVEHAEGKLDAALAAFCRARDHAERAGAVLEEATYLTGIASAAASLGDIDLALGSSERAILLFEALRRPRASARAALSRLAVYSQVGALVEAREAFDDVLVRARAVGDGRCEAYAHLCLADVLPDGDLSGLEHARRALGLLREEGALDRLRASARVLRRDPEMLEFGSLDAEARRVEISLEARLEWWGARARTAARGQVPWRPEPVLRELSALANAKAPRPVRGQAMAHGAELAARVGDGDTARRLALTAGDDARELLRRCSGSLRPALRALPWIAGLSAASDGGVNPEQLTDVEGLVRALGQRGNLKELLNQVLDALLLWTGVERGLLLLPAPGGKLVPRAARNLAKKDLAGQQRELSYSLAERARQEREPVVAVDATGELPDVHASVHALKLRSVLAVPLVARGEVMGVVYLDDRVRRGAFGPAELGWVRLVATLAAVAIADARDQLRLRRAARRAERAEAQLARALARREAQLDLATRELGRARAGRGTRFSYDEIVGESEPIRELLRLVDRVAGSDIPVLILGESGTGKELIARAIHRNSSRARGPFVSENCSAIPETLLESTLFGHARGAFTGATHSRAGLFEVAHGGTLFLDEVAEMSLPMQAKLLRVLEGGRFRPVGAERERHSDVRVLAATHRDMARQVAEGKFRQDLYYRLNVILVKVPPLRERMADLPLLVRHFIAKHSPDQVVQVSRASLQAMMAREWRGNVRELENEIRRALVLGDGLLDPEHLTTVEGSPESAHGSSEASLDLKERVGALEKELLRRALEKTRYNQTQAAKLLGVSRFGLQKMMRRLGLRAS